MEVLQSQTMTPPFKSFEERYREMTPEEREEYNRSQYNKRRPYFKERREKGKATRDWMCEHPEEVERIATETHNQTY